MGSRGRHRGVLHARKPFGDRAVPGFPCETVHQSLSVLNST